ncbi:hypothetical protein JXJ21_05420 [candidate division KSB1 bacterium]|nr:hypothetical protein [candidate division KSB1 bacterium]
MNYRNFALFLLIIFLTPFTCAQTPLKAKKIGTFQQQVRTIFSQAEGLPANEIYSIAIAANGDVYAGTRSGCAIFSKNQWKPIEALKGKPIWMLATNSDALAVYAPNADGESATGGTIYIFKSNKMAARLNIPSHLVIQPHPNGLALADKILLAASGDLFELDIPKTGDEIDAKPRSLNLPQTDVRQVAISPKGELVVAAESGLLRYNRAQNTWEALYPRQGSRSWALVDVRGVVYDPKGQLWFASPQGVGRLSETWSLSDGQDGLPYNNFTVVDGGEPGVVWFGTHLGAIRFDGSTWEYRQGMRWLPDDDVRDMAVSSDGNAWFATKNGVGLIASKQMTLAQKAKWFEDEIDKYHRRTPYEYVLGVNLKQRGDKSEWTQHDSDNDGLWTAMYGAGECFAYGATKDPLAKKRAKKAFEALRFLGEVTQGGSHAPPPGFVARTILPTSGRDPNVGRVEGDRHRQQHEDKLWKVYEPRWPFSADGKWYWKTDTSSDELDGHYFLYALYYDLVAETAEEKARVRAHVKALTDHLIEHDFQLVDHDGKPTRWARYSPKELNFDRNWWVERGLNSLSMLSYLAVTEHITGDSKYRAVADTLVEKHGYMQNMMNMKTQRGIGTGNQSDDEMAFMCYYNLLKYETDPERRSNYALSFWLSWRTEQPEMNPFFNFAFAATCADLHFTDAWGTMSTAPTGDWLEDAVETLRRFPLDRIDWRHRNSHRIDIVKLPLASRFHDETEEDIVRRGYRVNGKVIPVDEQYFDHWSYNPWDLDTGGNGHGLADGAVFLMPYYMGLYHGFIVESDS